MACIRAVHQRARLVRRDGAGASGRGGIRVLTVDIFSRRSRYDIRSRTLSQDIGWRGMGLRRVAPSTRGAVVGAVDAEVVAVLALLLRVFGAGTASDAAAVTEVAGLGDAL